MEKYIKFIGAHINISIYIYQDHSRSKHKKGVINFINPGGSEKLGFPNAPNDP
jgi:hypothetical protein